MNRCSSGVSPSTRRTSDTVLLRLFSSTTTSGQIPASSVLLSSASPACSTKYSSASNTFGLSAIAAPSAREHSAARIHAEAAELVDVVTLAIHRCRSEKLTGTQKKPALGKERPAGRKRFYAPPNPRPIRVGEPREDVFCRWRCGAADRGRGRRL